MSVHETLMDALYSEYFDSHGNVPPVGLLDSTMFDPEIREEGAGTLSMADGISWSDFRSVHHCGAAGGYIVEGSGKEFLTDSSCEQPLDFSLYVNEYDDQDQTSLDEVLKTPPLHYECGPYQDSDSTATTPELDDLVDTGSQISTPEVRTPLDISLEESTITRPLYDLPSSSLRGSGTHQLATGGPYFPILPGNFVPRLVPIHVPHDYSCFTSPLGYPTQHFVPQTLPFPIQSTTLPQLGVSPKRNPKSRRDKGSTRRVEPYARKDLEGHADIHCMWAGCNEVLLADGKTWRTHIKEHVNNDRSGNRRILCLWVGCGKEVDRGGMFRHAMGTHTSLLHESCPQCDYAGRGDMMQRHIQKKHLGN